MGSLKPNTPLFQRCITPTRPSPRRLEHKTEKRRSHQHSTENRERNVVATRTIEKKSEKRRPDGGEKLRNQQTHAANPTEGAAAKVVSPENVRQHHVAAETDAVEKKPGVKPK